MDEVIVAPIICLHIDSGPAAITGGIGPVWINTIQRMSTRRSTAHVRQEGLKVVSPSVTDSDSSATVVRVRRVADVVAPAFHPDPRDVFRCARFAVRCQSIALPLSMQAPTTQRAASGKGAARKSRCPTAVTSAVPVRVFLSICSRRAPRDSPSAEALARHIGRSSSRASSRTWRRTEAPFPSCHFGRMRRERCTT